MRDACRTGEHVRLLQPFGFGQRTGIELPAESKGRLRKKWEHTSLASVSMGQEVSVTTLQLARACSVIANGGLLVKPRLVLREGDQAVPVPAPRARDQAGDRDHDAADDGRGGACRARARKARLDGYRCAGQDGPGKIPDPVTHRYTHIYNGSFMGFAPLTNPAIVVVVTVNGTQSDGRGRLRPGVQSDRGRSAAGPRMSPRICRRSWWRKRRSLPTRRQWKRTMPSRDLAADGAVRRKKTTKRPAPVWQRRSRAGPGGTQGARTSAARRCARCWRRPRRKASPCCRTAAASRGCSSRRRGVCCTRESASGCSLRDEPGRDTGGCSA